MNDLIQALTRAANAVAVYYETAYSRPGLVTAAEVDADPTGAAAAARQILAGSKAEAAKTRKPRAVKEEAPKPAPVAPVVDPGLDILGLGAGTGCVPPLVELTEEESKLKANEMGFALVKRFNKPTGKLDPKGNPIPEGYEIARKLLADDFRVTRIGDLVHAARIQFVAKVKGLIAAADKVPA